MPLWERRRILEILQDAHVLAEGLGDEARVGRAAAFLAHYHWGVARYDESVEQARTALAIADRRGDAALWLSARFYLAQVQHTRGEYRAAADALGQLVAAVQEDLVPERFNMAGVGRVTVSLRRSTTGAIVPVLSAGWR